MAPGFLFFFFLLIKTGLLTAWFLCQLGNCHIENSHFGDSTVTDTPNNQAYSVRGAPKTFVFCFYLQSSLLSFGYFGFYKNLGLLSEGLRLTTKTSSLRAALRWDQHRFQSWTWEPQGTSAGNPRGGLIVPKTRTKHPNGVTWWDSPRSASFWQRLSWQYTNVYLCSY